MDRSATTVSPVAPSAPTGAGDEHHGAAYADLLRDLREALQEPPEFVFRAGNPPHPRLAA